MASSSYEVFSNPGSRRSSGRWGEVRVIAEIQPNVLIAVDKSQSVCAKVKTAILSVLGEIGRRWDDVELSLGKGLVAPLLFIVGIHNARQ